MESDCPSKRKGKKEKEKEVKKITIASGRKRSSWNFKVRNVYFRVVPSPSLNPMPEGHPDPFTLASRLCSDSLQCSENSAVPWSTPSGLSFRAQLDDLTFWLVQVLWSSQEIYVLPFPGKRWKWINGWGDFRLVEGEILGQLFIFPQIRPHQQLLGNMRPTLLSSILHTFIYF